MQEEKELFEWVKASDELPEETRFYICKKTGYRISEVRFNKQKELWENYHGNVIEWLKPITKAALNKQGTKISNIIVEDKDIDAFLRKMKVNEKTEIGISLLVELLRGFAKEYTGGLSEYIQQQYNRIVELVAKNDEMYEQLKNKQ